MATEKSDANFLDMQAHIGITKHVGGIEATDELLSLCHIGDALEVLNVGCGIGLGSAYIAKRYDCRHGPGNQVVHQGSVRRAAGGVSVRGIWAVRWQEVNRLLA